MRYFKGRAPKALSSFHDDSDEDEPPRPSSDQKPARSQQPQQPPTRRPRITARVVSAPTAAVTSLEPPPAATARPALLQRPKTSTFVPVNGKSSGTPGDGIGDDDEEEDEEDEDVSESESDSESSSSSSPSQRAADTNTLTVDTADQNRGEEVELEAPVFVSKEVRKASDQKRENEEELKEQREIQRIKRRQNEAKQLVSHVLGEERRRKDLSSKLDLPDDTDSAEAQEVDLALWKVRELLRIKRDRDEQIAWQNRTSVLSSQTVQRELNSSSAVPQSFDVGAGAGSSRATVIRCRGRSRIKSKISN